MDTTALVAAIGASTLVTDLTAILTALVTLILGVVGVVAVFGLAIGGIKKVAGMVRGAGKRL